MAARGRLRTAGTATMARAAATPSADIVYSDSCNPIAATATPREQVAEREQPGAGEVVVARDPGQGVLGHMLLQRRLPEREAAGDADTGQHLEAGDGPHAESAADERRLAGRAAEHQRGHPQREPGPPAEQQDVAENGADPEAGRDDRPVRRAAELVVHEHRTEHEDGRQDDDVIARHAAEEREHPRAAAHL